MGDEAERDDMRGEFEWRAQRYTARIGHRRASDSDQSRLNLAGSLALTADGFALGQPIRGSFVAVDLPELAGAEVYADGRLIGRTGERPVMVSDLSPWLPHTLSLQFPSEMPIGVDLPETQKHFALADRGGRWLHFAARQLRLYEGQVVRDDGQPVQFAPVTATRDNGVTVNTVTGEGGYLYLEHLEPGSYEFQVQGSKPCRFRAQLPDSAEPITQIGPQTCRGD